MTYAIDICFTNASAAEFILYRLKLYLAGRHHQKKVTTVHVRTGSVGEGGGAQLSERSDDHELYTFI